MKNASRWTSWAGFSGPRECRSVLNRSWGLSSNRACRLPIWNFPAEMRLMPSEEDISMAKPGETMLSDKRMKKNCIITIEF